jgi:hypothetical protein
VNLQGKADTAELKEENAKGRAKIARLKGILKNYIEQLKKDALEKEK